MGDLFFDTEAANARGDFSGSKSTSNDPFFVAERANQNSAQTYPLAEKTPLSKPEKIEGTQQDDKSAKPVKTYVFPPTLDSIPNSNTIIFEIMGEADIGVDFAESQRSNDKLKAAVNNIGTDLQGALNSAKDLYFGNNSKSSPGTYIPDNSFSEGISSVGSLGKSGTAALNAIGNSFPGADRATPTNMQEYWGSFPSAYELGLREPMKKLELMIKLPMPASGLNTSYGMEYENTALGLGGALMTGFASGQTLTEILKSSKGAAVRALAGGVAGALDDFTGGNKANINIGGLIEAGSRTVLNPRKEMLFKSVKYRSFEYSWIFAPNNASECKMVLEIIRIFKQHLHPTMEMNSFYMRYPSEFLISYHFNGSKENNSYLHNIGNCALTDLHIGYGKGSFSTLANGMPTSVSVAMSFMELEPLSRNRLNRDGY